VLSESLADRLAGVGFDAPAWLAPGRADWRDRPRRGERAS
jgi:hypothetical protein